MRALVFGRTGQVATELQRRCPGDWQLTALGRDDADLTDPAACAAIIAGADADVIINAAAYTAVDRAESEPDLAFQVNAAAPGAMAKAAARAGIPFVHLSTDYVFDGTGQTPWKPEEETCPFGVYGQSKRDGEVAVAGAGGPHVILRTAWVFSAHGQNFVKTMRRLAADHDTLRIVGDQVGGPTPAAAIADAVYAIAEHLRRGAPGQGIHHFAGQPDVSWAGFARAIFARTGHSVEVVDIPTTDYPTPAARPLNSRLDCRTLETDFGLARPDWREGLDAVLDELGAP
ncbi:MULTISPECIES: dTDP-4-dehydrorhamnose reductase [unclassified Roseitalea]|uniref:dTDP-4-dehydrorhamnose reductase n=1 Tax=unclassified Roseitalea TaxID=2639107 RepID=UPI00273E09F3|nr:MULTISPECIES: dTDP-4-dehydrorhamnose reductase [unclassified Roseitalea]